MDLSIGTRIKENYEFAFKYKLPRRTNILARIDGCHFHSYTRNCDKPYDKLLMETFDNTLLHLSSRIQGFKAGYTQSDEISVWMTDYDTLQTDAPWGGIVQKISSVLASMTTAYFNSQAPWGPATFDCRVFVIPEFEEVVNYFLWRHRDCERNSLSSLAREHYSAKQLLNKNSAAQHQMLNDKGINYKDMPARFKNGAFVFKNNSDVVHPDYKLNYNDIKTWLTWTLPNDE